MLILMLNLTWETLISIHNGPSGAENPIETGLAYPKISERDDLELSVMVSKLKLPPSQMILPIIIMIL